MTAISPSGRDYNYLRDWDGVDPVVTSAAVLVPLLLKRFGANSVLDVGCGTGTWLATFKQEGVARVRGCDGTWVPRDRLNISDGEFCVVDFEANFPPVERFDFAMSLEVAEHLSPVRSECLVDFLCASADVVFWSAAIPGQTGHGHINEQWQSHWVQIFRRRGFKVFDLVRPQVWHDADVSVWYRQNCLLFANAAACLRYGLHEAPFVADIVHPELFRQAADPRQYSLRTVLRHVPHYLRRWLARG